MKLLNADVLKEAIVEAGQNSGVEWGKNWKLTGEQIRDVIDNAQTVDAVRVVRCKDCKWWDKKDDATYGYCMAMKHGFVSSHWEIGIYRTYKGDFYCADGERREECI